MKVRTLKSLLDRKTSGTLGNYRIVKGQNNVDFIYFKDEPLAEIHNIMKSRKGAYFKLPFYPFKDRYFTQAAESIMKELTSRGYIQRYQAELGR